LKPPVAGAAPPGKEREKKKKKERKERKNLKHLFSLSLFSEAVFSETCGCGQCTKLEASGGCCTRGEGMRNDGMGDFE
jgi:hypothetical protein